MEDMVEGIAWIIFGLYVLVIDRRNLVKNATFGYDDMLIMPSEEWETLGTFGFGQVVALLLLLFRS